MTTTTKETCPVCQLPDVEVEHGARDAMTKSFVHIEHCPDCGDMYPTVCYDCPECIRAEKILAEQKIIDSIIANKQATQTVLDAEKAKAASNG